MRLVFHTDEDAPSVLVDGFSFTRPPIGRRASRIRAPRDFVRTSFGSGLPQDSTFGMAAVSSAIQCHIAFEVFSIEECLGEHSVAVPDGLRHWHRHGEAS